MMELETTVSALGDTDFYVIEDVAIGVIDILSDDGKEHMSGVALVMELRTPSMLRSDTKPTVNRHMMSHEMTSELIDRLWSELSDEHKQALLLQWVTTDRFPPPPI